MKYLLAYILFAGSLNAFANSLVPKIHCAHKDGSVLELELWKVFTESFESVRLNSKRGPEATQALLKILDSRHCVGVEEVSGREKYKLCKGELFDVGPSGKTFLSSGSVNVFLQVLAPAAGWSCQLED